MFSYVRQDIFDTDPRENYGCVTHTLPASQLPCLLLTPPVALTVTLNYHCPDAMMDEFLSRSYHADFKEINPHSKLSEHYIQKYECILVSAEGTIF